MRDNLRFFQPVCFVRRYVDGSVTASERLHVSDSTVTGGLRGFAAVHLRDTTIRQRAEASGPLVMVGGGCAGGIRGYDTLQIANARTGKVEISGACCITNATIGAIRGHSTADVRDSIIGGHVEISDDVVLTHTTISQGGCRAYSSLTVVGGSIRGSVEVSQALQLHDAVRIDGDVRTYSALTMSRGEITGTAKVSGALTATGATFGALHCYSALALDACVVKGDAVATTVQQLADTRIDGMLTLFGAKTVICGSTIGALRFPQKTSVVITFGTFGGGLVLSGVVFTSWWELLLDWLTIGLPRRVISMIRAWRQATDATPQVTSDPRRVALRGGTVIRGDITFDGGNGTVVVDPTARIEGRVHGGVVESCVS